MNKGGKEMAEQVLIQFRVDKNLKQDVAEICDALGTDIPTVFRMCMKQIIISRGIPFATSLPENVVTRAEALDAFEEMRKQAADVPEMSLEEINEEIRSARAERKSRGAVKE
jgi:DNA-damage-inducible protein J